MKTDKEKLIQLLEYFGVGFECEDNDIKLEEGNNKIRGYPLFYTLFSFDEKGKFLEVGAYE